MKAGTYRITVVDGETTREELVLADDFTIAPSFFGGGYGSLTLTLDGANVAYFPNGRWEGEVVRVEQPAAKAALDALSAKGDAGWVELNGYWRISTDGIKVQRRDWCEDGDPWVDTTEAPELVKLYRTGLAHGLSVAQAEHEALREQVRALVEALWEVERGLEPPPTAWDDVLDMARRLGEVLSPVPELRRQEIWSRGGGELGRGHSDR